LLGGVSEWVSEVFRFAAAPGVGVVRESVWVESAADKLCIVSLIDGEWSVDGILVLVSGGQQFWVDGWDGGDFWHFTSFASVTVPVFVSVVVQWVDGGTGPEVF
jgi:anti-sigma factor RsiW